MFSVLKIQTEHFNSRHESSLIPGGDGAVINPGMEVKNLYRTVLNGLLVQIMDSDMTGLGLMLEVLDRNVLNLGLMLEVLVLVRTLLTITGVLNDLSIFHDENMLRVVWVINCKR